MSGGVQEVSEPFAGLEVRDPLRRHLNKATHLGVPPGPSTVLAHPEASKSSELNLLPPHQGARDALEDRLDDHGAFLLGQAGSLRQLVNDLGLLHRSNPSCPFTTRGSPHCRTGARVADVGSVNS